jgi:hypothetical protein
LGSCLFSTVIFNRFFSDIADKTATPGG